MACWVATTFWLQTTAIFILVTHCVLVVDLICLAHVTVLEVEVLELLHQETTLVDVIGTKDVWAQLKERLNNLEEYHDFGLN